MDSKIVVWNSYQWSLSGPPCNVQTKQQTELTGLPVQFRKFFPDCEGYYS